LWSAPRKLIQELCDLASKKRGGAFSGQDQGASVLLLPPYSPDLNPIEKMWSKVKHALRSLEARTHEELLDAIAKALSLVSASDARNWFSACGYRFC
jgi:transposase